MNTDRALVEADLTQRVIGLFYNVYNELGAGFVESVYASALAIALCEAGINATREVPLVVHFRGRSVGEFRADFVVETRLILEIKAIDRLTAIHESQLINYLKTSGIHIGLLLNFGPRAEFKRRIFDQKYLDPCSSV